MSKMVRGLIIVAGCFGILIGLSPIVGSFWNFATYEAPGERAYKAGGAKRLEKWKIEQDKRICPKYLKALAENNQETLDIWKEYKHCADWTG